MANKHVKMFHLISKSERCKLKKSYTSDLSKLTKSQLSFGKEFSYIHGKNLTTFREQLDKIQ